MNCQQMGHYKSRCTNPHADEEDAGDHGGGDGANANTGAEDAAAGDAEGASWDSGGASGGNGW